LAKHSELSGSESDDPAAPRHARRTSGGAGIPRALLTSLEEHLVSLPGVTLARVEVRPTGEIVGIHLMVAAGVDTSSLINTVDETLRTTFDLKISPEQIFVAHVNARSGSSAARPGDSGVPFEPRRSGGILTADDSDSPRLARRVYFEDLEVRRSRTSGITCRVSLRKGALVLSGEVTGASSERSRAELASRATLAALGGNVFAPGFAILAMWLVAYCFMRIWRRSGAGQIVTMTPSQLEVATTSGTSSVRFHPYWAKVQLQEGRHRGWPGKLLIGSHGRYIEIGAFLNEKERRELAQRITELLREVQDRGRSQDTSVQGDSE